MTDSYPGNTSGSANSEEAVDQAVDSAKAVLDQGGSVGLNPEAIEAAKMGMAVELHDDWRSGMIEKEFVKKKLPIDTPRARKSKNMEMDEKWFVEHPEKRMDQDGTPNPEGDFVNSNVAFEDLPPSWQYDNAEAANAAVDITVKAIQEGTLDDVEGLSAEVHDAWIKRQLIGKGIDPDSLDSIYITDPVVAEAFKDDSWTGDQLIPFDELEGSVDDETSQKGMDAAHIRIAVEKLQAN